MFEKICRCGDFFVTLLVKIISLTINPHTYGYCKFSGIFVTSGNSCESNHMVSI